MHATALIAEDEPLLAAALCAELARAWPALRVVAIAGDGDTALAQSLQWTPQVLFLDIRMPGRSGLELAAALVDEWPLARAAFPAIVFVTAYDQYALQAFEAQAVDYLLKPVQAERLARTVQRLQRQLGSGDRLDPMVARLRALLAAADQGADTAADAGAPTQTPLRIIPASIGAQLRMIPVDTVLAFEAADKYLRVLTADAEALIRTPLRELLPRLDPERFWQIHRGTVVRADAIDQVTRDEAGRLSLRLRGRGERWPVSRLYAARFRAM